ncbi:hypothetical protein C8R48DRAFT_780521 [Suillus tomentosus]|nr:hypothetical protein C8R48DRAFT_780521 [Suillus tomentosus]
MAKRAASNDDQRAPKWSRMTEGTYLVTPSPKADEGAWRILENFLLTDATYPQTEEAFESHLGDRYSAEDWKDALAALFSGDGDDTIALANLCALKAIYVPQASTMSSNMTNATKHTPVATSALKKKHRSRRPFNPYINDAAEVDDNDNDNDNDLLEEEEGEEGERRLSNHFIDDQARESNDEDNEVEDRNGPSVKTSDVASLPGSSAKSRLATAIDDIVGRYQKKPSDFSRGRLPHKAAWFPSTIENRMYLLLVHRTAPQYIAKHLQSKGFTATVSAWVPGQLYVISDSPKTISASLPPSHSLSVRQYLCISEEEHEAVERTSIKLPNPLWVRIKHGKYKDAIAYVFDSEQSDLFVKVLVPPRDFPYPMPKGSVALLDPSRLPKDNTVTDILHGKEVVGSLYKGERYYKGLLQKNCHRHLLEFMASPHVDDIRLHVQSGWDTSFVEKTIVRFSMQFLRVGDAVRIVKGKVRSEISTVLSIDHALDSACLELTFDGDQVETEVQLHDLERVFFIGDTVQVVVGAYLGLEGHLIRISEDIFHICQDISKEEVQVSRHYLDRRPINHTFQPRLPTLQHYEPPHDDESIQVGDRIEVLVGEHMGKCGIVSWFPVGATQLWFHDLSPIFIEDKIEHSLGPPIIQVAPAFVRRTHLSQTITYTKERGYDVRPGDVVSVARGPDYQTKGVVQSVDFPKARLTLLSESDQSLMSTFQRDSIISDLSQIDVPIRFVAKIRNAPLDSFRKIINDEVFLIGGDRKGFRATLYSIGMETCVVAVHGQARITVKCKDVATRYGMRLNGVILGTSDLMLLSDLRRRSYLTSPPRRCTTPPPDRVPSASSTSTRTDSSVLWTSWSTNPEDINAVENPSSIVGPSSSTFDPWTVNEQDIQDNLDAGAEKVQNNGPLHWLMSKEFASQLLTHHALLKVSLKFNGG